jgi:hypothetical protein
MCGCGLRVPDVTGATRQLATAQGSFDGIAVGDAGPRGVDQIRATLHPAEQLVAERTLRLGVQRRIDRDDVAVRHHVGGRLVPGEPQLLLRLARLSSSEPAAQLQEP